MTLPSSGPLSLSDIQGEFGGSNPIGMNEYYAGGGLVPAGTTGTYGAVPSSGALSVQNFYGTSNFVPIYIEDVFSTWLYTGTAPTTQNVVNGINLSGNGGLVWLKNRNYGPGTPHIWTDTTRGVNNALYSNSSAGQDSAVPWAVSAFNSNGFSTAGSDTYNNALGNDYASWTFRKQPKFFDVVTYTGNGSSTQTISHNLGAVPGCIIVKKTSNTSRWNVYHRSLTAGSFLKLNLTAAQEADSFMDGANAPTSTTFTAQLATSDGLNANGETYVAYLFAHNAGGFGLTGTDNVISCGSFTGTGSLTSVNLGYEPQWVLFKRATGSTDNWRLLDNMRGWSLSRQFFLFPNNTDAETDSALWGNPTATGMDILGGGGDYIYVAIRRGPMKVPTSGTSVFSNNLETSSTNPQTLTTGFPVDLSISTLKDVNSTIRYVLDRLRGSSVSSGVFLQTNGTNAETATSGLGFQNNTGLVDNGWWNTSGAIFWNFRRAPSFFDEVCYTGNGAGASQVNNHNLGVVPELIISKKRSASGGWVTWATGLSGSTYYLQLNATDGEYNGGATLFRSSTQYTWYWGDNVAGATYVTYLFASCPNVSKVGSYSGTGSTQTISCGFTGGARWVMVKRIDVDGYGWYVWDTARGMVAGTDPSLLLNSTAAEVNANSIYTTTGGFQIVSTAAGINASGGTYIFLAIA